MARIPEKPHQEFLITAAGPATNVLLAFLLGGLALVWIGPRDLLATFTSYVQLSRLVSSVSLQTLLLLLTLNNIGLALFNLIPAFPMDGGRLLRAMLAAILPFRHATPSPPSSASSWQS